ncbi:unnamed protein product [Callosobruchus maculatus]|uniref:apyrase n=1 Tax=Callosobruchus maculatus TaxID=64391 RepID=A0A653DPC8_CALMS|nr:unnamed protein product [Callosobruchus maculatus]
MIFMPGGFSRLYAQIMKMLEEKPNSVLLNAGDDFQGTMYYSIGKWNITQQFMNKLPFDAQVLGNHEFDDGIDGVVPYIKALKHPVIVSNIDDSLEPKMQGIYSKSTVIERNGKKIGIVGVIVEDCDEISNTGKLRFLPESASVNAEAERLVEEEGVFTVIVLSHSGYDHDRLMAKNASDKISLIVGGHSHTFLYTGDNPPGPETPKGPYPTIVQKPNGHNVLVTQASAFSKYLGNVTVYLDKNGEIADFVGAPIFLSPELPQDEKINKDLEPWKRMIDAQGSKIIGSTLVTLDKSACYHAECTLGNFMADAMVFAYTKKSNEYSWTQGAIAMTNSGGGRTTIEVGTPFGNTIDIGNMKGKHVKALLERNMFPYTYNGNANGVKLMQYSGVQIVFDMSRPVGDRVVSAKLRCQNCTIPIYEDLDEDRTYRIIHPSFLGKGRDGFTEFRDYMTDVQIGPLDIDVFTDYLAHRSPVFEEIEGRTYIRRRDLIVDRNSLIEE